MENKFLNVPFDIKDIGTDGTFKGYGSTFGGKPDSYGDVVVEGAFSKTLNQGGRNGNGIAMLWQHNSSEPIGVWTSLIEDAKGLAVEGKLEIESEFGKRVYALMKMGALKGLSIGYNAIKWLYDKEKEIRDLLEIALWEISPVTFPANIGATITGVKSIEQAKNLRELESALRESGMSRGESLNIISICKSVLRESAGWNNVLSVLRDINYR